LQAAGYFVLHVTPRQVFDEVQFVGTVRSWLSSLSRRS
jgi:hypothetical protein